MIIVIPTETIEIKKDNTQGVLKFKKEIKCVLTIRLATANTCSQIFVWSSMYLGNFRKQLRERHENKRDTAARGANNGAMNKSYNRERSAFQNKPDNYQQWFPTQQSYSKYRTLGHLRRSPSSLSSPLSLANNHPRLINSSIISSTQRWQHQSMSTLLTGHLFINRRTRRRCFHRILAANIATWWRHDFFGAQLHLVGAT